MKTEEHILESPNKHKDFVVSGSLVSIRDRPNKPAAAQAEATPRAKGRVLTAGEILTIEEVAAQTIDGLDMAKSQRHGRYRAEARLFIHRPNGKLARHGFRGSARVRGYSQGASSKILPRSPRMSAAGAPTNFYRHKGCLGECGRCASSAGERHPPEARKGVSTRSTRWRARAAISAGWNACAPRRLHLVDGKTFDPGCGQNILAKTHGRSTRSSPKTV
jgi:hypothetical protein